jgi:hypothetical protein
VAIFIIITEIKHRQSSEIGIAHFSNIRYTQNGNFAWEEYMRKYENIGLAVPEIYLPQRGIDLQRWAVIACDQFTSQPEYWKEVRKTVGDSPSTYNLTLPEVFLGTPEEAQRLIDIYGNMQRYLEMGILQPHVGIMYIERTVADKTRKGLLVCLDLEEYDYNTGSTSLIRATEGTILDRLPPRIKIRENAPLELPHILVLIDDPENKVIGKAQHLKSTLPKLYDFNLMLGSGHLTGWLVDDIALEKSIVDGLVELANLDVFQQKYGLPDHKDVLLYAMGDGNHSLATAKAIWEKVKPVVGMDHPARYALVELENIHDPGLEFEPIHRVLFDVNEDLEKKIKSSFMDNVKFSEVENFENLAEQVKQSTSIKQRIGYLDSFGFKVVELTNPSLNLPVGNLQKLLDALLLEKSIGSIDYVHGSDAVLDLGRKPGNVGFYLPTMGKEELFKTVILEGALPRKTFSMGEAIEKRLYLEARIIK